MGVVKAIVRRIAGDGLISRVKEAIRWSRYCHGVYETFEAASAAITHGTIGYDNEASTHLYVKRLEETRPSDYPVFFWLRPLLADIHGVFDFGGNLGWSYYSFQKYLKYPDHLRWYVFDVPAVIRAGETLAKERRAPHLSFTEEMPLIETCEVFYTSGTLQYIEADLSELLRPRNPKPRYVFVNRVPFSDLATYYTIQDIGSAQCPYRIANRRQFVEAMERLGYTLIDQWRCPESWCSVLFRPARHVAYYSGMYFLYNP